MIGYPTLIEEQSPEQSRLYETCLKGSREEIRNCCKTRDISKQYLRDGMNPMHVVAVAGRQDAELIFDIMLQSGFDVNAVTKSGDDTVLHLVVEHVDVKQAFPLVLKILEYNPDLTIRNRKLRTPYDIALAKGEFELAEVLDGTMTPEQAREFYTRRIGTLYGAKLVDAVLNSQEGDMKEFINLGADPNYVNEHKNGAIHYAITHCKLPPHKTLALLIHAGADVNLQDDEGDTALNLVIKSFHLRESGEMYKCCELLVQHGALSTFKDLDGNDALLLAKKREYSDIVTLLTTSRPQHVQESALPDFTTTDDFLHPEPGQYLQLSEEPETVPDFPESELNEQQPTPRRPPVLAVPTPSPEPPTPEPPPPQQLHLPRFSPPPPLDDDDDDFIHPPPMQAQTSLIRATREGTVQDVKDALQDLNADPNIPDDTGLYPIHHVCIRGQFDNENDRIEMLRELVNAEADINMQTVNSESTALHVAATNNQDHVAKFLLDTHKCDYNVKNKNDKTAYEVAEEEECQEVMDVIDNHRKAVRDRMRKAAKTSTCTIL